MDGLFDDLIPAGPAPATGSPAAASASGQSGSAPPAGLFDDLIPNAAASAGGVQAVDDFGRPISSTSSGSDPGTATDASTLKAVPAFLDGAANAVPFTDRAAAAAAAAAATGLGGTFGDYSGNLAQLRSEEGGAMAAHPAAALAGSVVGGAALPIPALGLVGDGATLGAKAVRGAMAGGLIGGAQGASSSPDLTDMGQTAKDAGIGAGVGSFVGGALPAAASGFGAASRFVTGDAVPAVDGLGTAARDVYLSAISKDGQDAVQRNAALYGDPAMMFDYGPSLKGIAQGLATKDGPAAATVGDALGMRQAATNDRVRTGLMDNFGVAQDPAAVSASIDDVGQAATQPLFAQAYAAGAPYSPELADLVQRPAVAGALQDAATSAANAGQPLGTITLDAAGQPVASDAAMQAFDAGTRPAVTNALSQLLGADPSRGPLSIEDALSAQRSAAADPLYAAWRSTSVPMTPDLADVLGRPSVAAAIPAAERKAADQGRTIFAQASGSAPSWERDPLGPSATPGAPGSTDVPGLPLTPDNSYTVPYPKPTPPDVPRPQTARDVVRGLGGVRDTTGDLTAAGVDEMGPGIGKLIQPASSGRGVTPDQASEVLAQLGYFGADTNAAMRGRNASMLADALTSHPTYPEGPEGAAWLAHDRDLADWEQFRSDNAGDTLYRDPKAPGPGPAPSSYAPEDMGLPPGGVSGGTKAAPQLTPEGLDYLGRTLGDKIDTAQRAGSRDDARIYTGLKNQLTAAVDNHPDPDVRGAWTAARQAYAAPSAEIDALQTGRAALADAVTPEQIAREYGGLETDGQRQQYRNGLFSAMRDKLGKASDTANFVNTVAGNQALRDKFAAVAPHPDALNTFNSAMDRARQTFTEATQPTPEALHGALGALDARAAKGELGVVAARDALAAHLGQNPDFARARGIQGDYAGLQDAIDYGRRSLAAGNDPVWPSAFQRQLEGMSPAGKAAARLGQRSLMEEAVGTKPNDQLAIKGLFQTGNTPGYTAPGVTPGNPDLSGWNAQKIAAAHGQAPVANMQEVLNANDAFHDTFQGVLQNSATARRQAMVKALEDAEWQPRDLMAEGHGDDTTIGLIRSTLAKGVNAVGHAFQSAPSNVVRDADLARVGTLTGQSRTDMLANLLDRLPAYQGQEAATTAVQKRALALSAAITGGVSGAAMDPAKRSRMLVDAFGGQR